MTVVAKKAFQGFFFLMIVWGIFVFLPAWTLNYWQGWFYMFVFFGSSFAITVYFLKKNPKLIENRLYAGPIAEKEKNQKQIQSAASFFSVGVLVVSGFDHRFLWSHVSAAFSIISNIIVLISFIIIFYVFRENSYTSSIIEVGNEQKVIMTGPYAIVRHPMYSGALLMFLFTPTALGSLCSIPFGIGVIFVIIFRLLDEEKFLSKNLEGYNDYCNKVHFRLVPYVW